MSDDELNDIPLELQEALVVLLRHADRAPTASMDLKNAVRVASRYVPRPFAAEDYPGLPEAMQVIGALAAKRYPRHGNQLNGWPDSCTPERAEYVHGVLMHHRALPLVVLHAPLLAEVTLQPKLVTAASELHRRLCRLDGTPRLGLGLGDWARSVHEAVVELHGYLLGVPRRVRPMFG